MRTKLVLVLGVAVAVVATVIAWQGDDGDGGPTERAARPGAVAPADDVTGAPGPGDIADDEGSAPGSTSRRRAEAPAPASDQRVGEEPVGPPVAAGCDDVHLCIGAAKASVAPSEEHIAGVVESRLFLGTRLQRFNLGGFGLNPLQGTPDPDGSINEALNQPAEGAVFSGSRGPEPLSVRALVLQEPAGETVTFLTLDATGAGNVIQDRLVGAVADATGIPVGNVLFGQTHTHAGADLQGLWGGVPQAWIDDVLLPQAVGVVQEALRTSRAAELEVRSGAVRGHNSYRRPKRIDPTPEADPIGSLLRARDARTGAVIGDLLQFSAHPTSIDEDPRLPHPDYVLGALDWLERDGGVALYFNGPIADASGAGSRAGCSPGDDADYGAVRCRGEGIAAAVLALEARPVREATLAIRHQPVVLPVTNPLFLGAGAAGAFNRYYDFIGLPADALPFVGPHVARALLDLPQLVPTASTTVSRVTIGGADAGVELVTIPGESTGTFGAFIRGLAAPGADVVLLGLTNDSLGYIIPEEEFSYVDGSGEAGLLVPFTGYEEFVSLGPLTAPILRATGYVPVFDADPSHALPSYLSSCLDDATGSACLLHVIGRHLDYVQVEQEANCLELGGPAAFCSLLNPDLPLQSACAPLVLPSGMCDLIRPRPGGA